MRRDQLEHLIRAAGQVLDADTVIVIGSQAFLASVPAGLPPEAVRSIEADILPIDDPDETKADLIDGLLGEASTFQETHGIYAQGVGQRTARLPEGWQDRLVALRNENTGGVTGKCLEPHDVLRIQPRGMTHRIFRGLDVPTCGETMVGLHRLRSFEECVSEVLSDGVPGDFVEAGAWRGGTAILMRAVLKTYHVTDRKVFVADSFRGLPPPKRRYGADRGDRLWADTRLAVSLAEVRANFARYGLLDDQVAFIEGWFSESLKAAPIERLAVLRLDADMYESTLDALEVLYPKVSPGGFVIVDDYGALEAGRRAGHD